MQKNNIPKRKMKSTTKTVLISLVSGCALASSGDAAEIQKIEATAIDYSSINIREYKAKSLPFSKILTVGPHQTEKIIFDEGYRGRLCFISCHFYDGYTSRWSKYYLDLQPYESTCFSLAGGCTTTTFPRPNPVIDIAVGNKNYKVYMIDEERYRYYLPLALRKEIALNKSIGVTIKAGWDKYREYTIGKRSRPLLAQVLDSTTETEQVGSGVLPKTSTEERINELNLLRNKGLISEQEFEMLRNKALGL